MSHASPLIATDIDAYLEEHQRKDLLRVFTCGSVDDGKSTLIGRLLHDSHLLYDDQLASLQSSPSSDGSEGELDLALLTDGLRAEREQGITIDVAYRYFSTSRRKFIIADTPGHEQYTRNMATGASTADLAVILIDAQAGITDQTRRHTYIATLLGINQLAVTVNKMDLVGWSQDRFEDIVSEYQVLLAALPDGLDMHFIPVSALTGDNVVDKSSNLAWFDGPTLMEHLESTPIGGSTAQGDPAEQALRFPVQLAVRPGPEFRGFAGTVESGTLEPGDMIRVEPSGITTTIDRLVTFDGDLDQARPGQAVTFTTTTEVDIGRGDVVVDVGRPLERSHTLDVATVWLSAQPLKVGTDLLVQHSHRRLNAKVTAVREIIDVTTLHAVPSSPGKELELNTIAHVILQTDAELLFDAYSANRSTGSLILIDRITNATVGAGMIRGVAPGWDHTPEGALEQQSSEVTAHERSTRYAQVPSTIFLTGLTGSGKSTLARALERKLFDQGRTVVRIDGENLRLGMSRDLGFTAPERSENVRRAAEVAALVNRQGLMVISALIAPDARDRARARELIGDDRFVEVHLDPPIEVCRSRDTTGQYLAAEQGELDEFPGVSAPYDVPENPSLTLDTHEFDVDSCVNAIVELMERRKLLN